MLSVSSSIEGINTNYYEINNNLINSVNFSFPISKTMCFSIGLSPYSRDGYNIEDDDYNIFFRLNNPSR